MARKTTTTKAAAAAQQLSLQAATALYVRVSTDNQAEHGFSLDEQQERLRAHCVAQGWSVNEDHIYIDAGVSGKSSARPEFQRMMADAESGVVGRVVAIKLDRLARNTKNFLALVEKLEAWDCDMVLIKESFDTSTPNGKFALTMFAAIAELEASTITERVMSGKRQKASQGGYNGAYCPLGYIYDVDSGEFSTDDNADTVQSIFAAYIEDQNLNAIARQLDASGATTAKGGKWYPATVKYILSNGFYAGIAQYDDKEVDGAHPAIISKETYEQAHALLLTARKGPKVAA